MNLETKYNIGDYVWVINGKTGQVVEREILGIRTQWLGDKAKTSYSFLKDRFRDSDGYYDYLQYDPIPEHEKYFWLNEDVCYESKEELKNNL